MSCDHIISNLSGLIPHMREFLTSHTYNGTVIFVEHASKLPCVYLFESTSMEGLLSKNIMNAWK